MSLTIPAWYLWGSLITVVFSILRIGWFCFQVKKMPYQLKDLPGVLVLVVVDALFSWLALGLGLYQLIGHRKQRKEMIEEYKRMNLERG